MADEVPTVAVLMVVAIPTSVAVGALPMVAVDSTAAALTAVDVRTVVAVDVNPAVAVDSTQAAALAAVAADILPAAILAVGCHLDPHRGAVARPKQLPLSINRHLLLHQELSEPTALPPPPASGIRLETAGIPLS